MTTREGGNCDLLKLEGRTRVHQLFRLFLAKFILRIRRNLFPSFP